MYNLQKPYIVCPVGTTVKELERIMIIETLFLNRGNRSETARQLGISLSKLNRKIDDYESLGHQVPEPFDGRPRKDI